MITQSVVPIHIYNRCVLLAAVRKTSTRDFLSAKSHATVIEWHEEQLATEVAAWRTTDPFWFELVMSDLRTRDLLDKVRASLVGPEVVRRAYAVRPQVSIAKVPEDFGPFEIEDEL